ncbi:hypothetical protein [Helcobacillus massiliensis]|uniref:Uncharacterized protein n=1 Tax=Helcobacillus massiliensis TaxID=521392 RepID=A0A839QYZ9_9MICO|nr:hypothetical protein [Helcobacillus massiliensis]MBB3024019.1 hypothetical protein [Helcobacillus massiliensis]
MKKRSSKRGVGCAPIVSPVGGASAQLAAAMNLVLDAQDRALLEVLLLQT